MGKSSLLNALLLSPHLNHVGPRPGKTTTMHAWGLAASDPLTGGALRGHGGDTSIRLAVLDMPGYGHASHGDWGNEIITYLRRRKQLKRVFVLLDALHGVKDSDLRMLDLLRKQAISHQVIASKCDRLGKGKVAQTALTEALWKMRNATQPKSRAGSFVGLGEILAVGALGDGRKNDGVKDDTMMGIEEVRYAVLKAAGLESAKSLQDVIPGLDGTQLSPFLHEKLSIGVWESEAGAAEQTSPPVYLSSDPPEAEAHELPSSIKTTTQTHTTEDPVMTADEVRSAIFEPPVSDHPPSDPHGPSEPPPKPLLYPRNGLIRKKNVEPVLPIHKTKVTLGIDKVHKAIPKLPSPDAQNPPKPYAGRIGYGLRDLYEMTRTKPESDSKVKRVMTHLVLEGQGTRAHRQRSKLAKVNARRHQRRRRDGPERIVS